MIGSFSILEVVIGVFVIISLIRGITRGLSGQILKIVGIVGGALAAKAFYEKAGTFLSEIESLSEKLSALSQELVTKVFNIAGFALVWVAVIIIASLLALLIKPKKDGKKSLDKLLGAAVSLVIWYAIISAVLGVFDSIPTDVELLNTIIEPLHNQIYEGAYLKFFAGENNFIGNWIIEMFANLIS